MISTGGLLRLCYVVAAQFETRCCDKNQAEEQFNKRQELSHSRLVEKTPATKMSLHAAVETYTGRAFRHGDYMRTYSEPAVALSMSESLRVKTRFKAIDLGCRQGVSLKHWRAVGADIV